MNGESKLPRGQTTTDLIADALRDAIRQGRFGPGEDLTQEMIAAQFGVSRVPLREAMRRLEAEGLIMFYANRGAVVTELSLIEVREIYELRILIEGDLIYRAARVITPNELRKTERIHEALELEQDPKEQDALNRAFHAALYAPAGRPRQRALVENLRNLVERSHNVNRSLMIFTCAFQQDHRKILNACRQRNPERARARLVEHLEHAMKIALEHLRKRQYKVEKSRS